jgi:hypothetical protein
MGFQPGPLFAQILHALEDAQLEGQIGTREEAEQFVMKAYRTKQVRSAKD